MKSPLSHRCLPGSFFVVFLARATSLAVLVSLTRDTELRRPRSDRVWLAGLMLPILGVGCVVAFLWKKAGFSSYARSACGCTFVVSWVALMLESPCLISECRPETSLAIAVIRIVAVLNSAGHCWMLSLISSLPGLLEKSSNQKNTAAASCESSSGCNHGCLALYLSCQARS